MNEIRFCRLCASLTNFSNSENLFEHRHKKLLQQVEELTGIQIKNTKNLPHFICIPCQAQTMQAHEFRERCIRTQQHFNTAEYRNRNEVSKGDNILNDIKTAYAIKQEGEDDQENKAGENDGDVLMPIRELLLKPKAVILNNQEDLNRSQTKTIVKRKKRGYICDQCGRHFKESTVLKEHLARHAGIKQFLCEFCPKKFTTYPERNIHLRTHTGEKPIPCRYCDIRFRSCSQRATHERIHMENQRPHACSQCDKSYAKSSQLKSHFLVHTGRRPYECKYCKLAYTTRKLLLQHQRSQKHKTNVANQ